MHSIHCLTYEGEITEVSCYCFPGFLKNEKWKGKGKEVNRKERGRGREKERGKGTRRGKGWGREREVEVQGTIFMMNEWGIELGTCTVTKMSGFSYRVSSFWS